MPAYFYPLPGSPWDQLAATAKAMPSVSITAIVNPGNGPGKKADTQYAQALRAFTGAGGKAIGYVSTRYGNGAVSQATIRQHIDRYLAFYGRDQISGFFLDEMSNKAAQLGFYREIYNYIKGLDNQLQVLGNPGTLPVGDYATVADSLVTFEGQAVAYERFNPQPQYGWVYQYANDKQAMLVHDALDCPAMQSSLSTAATERSHTGWVYATDLHYDYANNIGDPWARLPVYWSQLLGTVDAINKGSALPSC
ncbi:MAG TPA: spherulation-specific family 4 protein [Alicycliphilus sp.]|nr:spherulation-specific family 4 protein [Alicycliphilus sp.]